MSMAGAAVEGRGPPGNVITETVIRLDRACILASLSMRTHAGGDSVVLESTSADAS